MVMLTEVMRLQNPMIEPSGRRSSVISQVLNAHPDQPVYASCSNAESVRRMEETLQTVNAPIYKSSGQKKIPSQSTPSQSSPKKSSHSQRVYYSPSQPSSVFNVPTNEVIDSFSPPQPPPQISLNEPVEPVEPPKSRMMELCSEWKRHADQLQGSLFSHHRDIGRMSLSRQSVPTNTIPKNTTLPRPVKQTVEEDLIVLNSLEDSPIPFLYQ